MATAVSDLLTMSPAQLDELFTRSDSGPTCLSAHILDLIMQSLGIKTQSSPFEAPYFSCVPYLLGEGQAMQYSVWPKSKKKDSDSAASITPARRLPARRDGRFTCRRRRRVRHPLATANRSAPYADRKQRRALAREAFTSRIGGHVASPAAEIRLYGADRVRKTAFIQSVALHSRASATGKSKPCSAPDVRGAFEAPAHDECRATLRTDWRRGIRLGGFA